MYVRHAFIGLHETCAASPSVCLPERCNPWLELQEARELREVYTERDKLQSQLDTLNAEVTERNHVLRHDRLRQCMQIFACCL